MVNYKTIRSIKGLRTLKGALELGATELNIKVRIMKLIISVGLTILTGLIFLIFSNLWTGGIFLLVFLWAFLLCRGYYLAAKNAMSQSSKAYKTVSTSISSLVNKVTRSKSVVTDVSNNVSESE